MAPASSACIAVAVAVLLPLSGCIDATGAHDGPTIAQALLWSSVSSSIVVEVDAVPGHGPDGAALDLLRTTLAEATGKAVAIAGPSPLRTQGGGYRERDLERIHREAAFFGDTGATGQPGYLDGGRAVLHVLYLDGRMASDDEGRHTLGRSLLDHGLVVVFRDTYAQAHRIVNGTWRDAGPEMDAHVLLHEVGHALGLVGNGIPQVRDHDDPGSPGHSRYPESVMYHHPPMTPAQLVTGPVSTTFDVDDLADLASFRARDPGRASP